MVGSKIYMVSNEICVGLFVNMRACSAFFLDINYGSPVVGLFKTKTRIC